MGIHPYDPGVPLRHDRRCATSTFREFMATRTWRWINAQGFSPPRCQVSVHPGMRGELSGVVEVCGGWWAGQVSVM